MYGEDETVDNNSLSNLDQKNESKYNSPLYTFCISFLIHIIYLLLFLFLIYSVIIYHTQIFNSGLFDNTFNNVLFGGYCSPFSSIKSEDPSTTSSTSPSNEEMFISIFNLIKFDYMDENINNECNKISDESDPALDNDTENKSNTIVVGNDSEYRFSYGLVTFDKKYINYLYKYFGFNLSNGISFTNYRGSDNIVYSYSDNLGLGSLRNIWGLNILWVISDLIFCLPIMFCLDTIRKAFVYNIVIYIIIYKLVYRYFSEGLLLLILGFAFIYYPTPTISFLFSIPCFISGIIFLLVFLCNFIFQIYNYIFYSIELQKKIDKQYNEDYNKSSKTWWLFQTIFMGRNFFVRSILTVLKVFTVIIMFIWFGITISQIFVIFLSFYMIIFLYLIIPILFRGKLLIPNSTANSSDDSSNSSIVNSDSNGGTIQSISIDKVIKNDKEDYSLLSIWYGLLYKKRYIYILIIIIFSIDFAYSGILSDTYNWIVILFVILFTLFSGYYFNNLKCRPNDKNKQGMTGGGINILEKFKSSPTKLNYYLDEFHYFSKDNPYDNLKTYKSSMENNKCDKFICNNAYIHEIDQMFAQYFSSDPDATVSNDTFIGCQDKDNLDNYQPAGGVSKIIMNMIDYLLKV